MIELNSEEDRFPKVKDGDNYENERYIVANKKNMLVRIASKIVGQFTWKKVYDFKSIDFDNRMVDHTEMVTKMYKLARNFRREHSKFNPLSRRRRETAITELQVLFDQIEKETILLETKTFVEAVSHSHRNDYFDHSQNRSSSLKEVFSMLESISYRVSNGRWPLTYDKKLKVLRVIFDDDIVLEEVNLGKMSAYLDFQGWNNYFLSPVPNDTIVPQRVVKIAADNPAYPLEDNFSDEDKYEENKDAFHPHIAGNFLCFGNQLDAAKIQINDFEIAALCRTIKEVLHNYNKESIYLEIEYWKVGGIIKEKCYDCGSHFIVDEDGSNGGRMECGHYVCSGCNDYTCRSCRISLCNECARSCDCGNSTCGDCEENCEGEDCSTTLCRSCKRRCNGCDKYFCTNCMSSHNEAYCKSCEDIYSECENCGESMRKDELNDDYKCATCAPPTRECLECDASFSAAELEHGVCESCRAINEEDEEADRQAQREAEAAAEDEEDEDEEDNYDDQEEGCDSCGDHLTAVDLASTRPHLCAVCRIVVENIVTVTDDIPNIFEDLGNAESEETTQTETQTTEEPAHAAVSTTGNDADLPALSNAE